MRTSGPAGNNMMLAWATVGNGFMKSLNIVAKARLGRDMLIFFDGKCSFSLTRGNYGRTFVREKLSQ